MRRRRSLARLRAGETIRVGPCELRATDCRNGVVIALSCVSPTSDGNPCAGAPCRRSWLSRALANDWWQVLAQPDCTADLRARIFSQLATSPELSVRVEVAGDPTCPGPTLDTLAGDWWWEVRAAVAANRACPPSPAARLAFDANHWVRRALADNPLTTPAQLVTLAGDVDFGVRDAVAEHPACPTELLASLAGDPTWEIRRSVAKRPDAPPDVLAALASDPEHWVRFFVAANPSTPAEVREQLAVDRRPSVRGLARRSRRRSRAVALSLASEVNWRPSAASKDPLGRAEVDASQLLRDPGTASDLDIPAGTGKSEPNADRRRQAGSTPIASLRGVSEPRAMSTPATGGSDSGRSDADEATDPAGFWDARYGDSDRVWSGKPNAALVDSVTGTSPRRALDLGCGEGGDSVWLAEMGWQVTAIDVSATAVGRGRTLAESRGIPEGRITWLVEDLATWEPAGTFELVTCCFLHSPVELPRTTILRRAAACVAPGGRLLVVAHAEAPPWAREHHHEHAFPAPGEELTELALDPAIWDVTVSEVRSRRAVGPDGMEATLRDTVTLAERKQ